LVFLVKTDRYLSLAEIVIFIAYEFLKWAVMFLNDCIFLAEEKEYWLLAEMIRKVCEKLLKWCIKHYFGLLKEFIELFFSAVVKTRKKLMNNQKVLFCDAAQN
jgi:hypothetical protein